MLGPFEDLVLFIVVDVVVGIEGFGFWIPFGVENCNIVYMSNGPLGMLSCRLLHVLGSPSSIIVPVFASIVIRRLTVVHGGPVVKVVLYAAAALSKRIQTCWSYCCSVVKFGAGVQ